MIIPMKKAFIAVLKEDYENVIKSLQKYEIIMIVNQDDGENLPINELNENLFQKVEKSIKFSKQFEEKQPLFGEYREIDYNSFETVNKETITKVNEIEELQNKINSIEQELKSLEDKKKTYLPWIELDLKTSEIVNSKYCKMSTGYIPTSKIEKFKLIMEEGEYVYQILGKSNIGYSVFFAYYITDDEKITSDVKSIDYNEFVFPKYDISLKEVVEQLDNEINELNSKIATYKDGLRKLAESVNEYRLLSDQIICNESISAVKYQSTLKTSLIEGWVRSDQIDDLEKSISDVTEFYDFELLDPNDGETPPTYTKNSKVVSQFEGITDMFSKPNSRENDPNPVMSIWYWILFGMMVGDVGYGIIMLLVCLFLKQKMHAKGGTLKLINVIMYSSIPTIIWGIIFGSYFGFNPQTDWGLNWVWYWFSPMNEPIQMLILSVAVGAGHLITGLIMNAIQSIRDKDYAHLLAKDISWILIMLGIGLYFLIPTLGIIVAVLGVILIIFFAGASHKNIIGRAAFGVLGLYDATSYLSDLLSYSRVMALVMSSASIAMVMNTLAQMVSGSIIGVVFGAIIFLIGHLFNLVLGLLSAYVHDCRLQYIEFFGKFYEGGGVDFKPLSLKTKYINKIK